MRRTSSFGRSLTFLATWSKVGTILRTSGAGEVRARSQISGVTEGINANFPGTGVFPTGPQVVTCYTCHPGDPHPVSLSNRRYELPTAKP